MYTKAANDKSIELLHARAVEPRQKLLQSIVSNRTQQLTRLYYAIKEKSRSQQVGAGLDGVFVPASVSDDDDKKALQEFIRTHDTTDSLSKIDLNLPPMSPSPPPSAGASAPSATETNQPPTTDVDQASSSQVAAGTAEKLQAPKLIVNGAASASPDASGASTIAGAGTAPLSANAATATSGTNLASAEASTSKAIPSTPLQPSLTISPSLLQQLTPTSPVPAAKPYSSMFGIPEISFNYASTLPELPTDIVKTRFNSTSRRKGKDKAAPPPDLYKMNIRAQHMGAKNFLGRGKTVHNVLTTHDWGVALEELRAVRAFERVEQMKTDKAWSFRQPKKQRIGLVPKSHWDHLMDEMRWLQTDFRQERRWKVATAHSLARAVKAWHKADPETRLAMQVKFAPPRVLSDVEVAEGESVKDESTSKPMSRQTSLAAAAMDVDADGSEDADGDIDDSRGEADVSVEGAEGETAADSSSSAVAKPTEGSASQPETTSNTRPGSPSTKTGAATPAEVQKQSTAAHVQNLIALRAPVFELGPETTIVDPQALSDVDDPSLSASLSAMFPDLPLYSDFLLASDPATEKRIEDSSAWAGRLTHVTKLLETKPLLVSTIQPGRMRKQAAWDPSTAHFLEDQRDPADQRDSVPHTNSVLFAGPKPKPKEGADAFTKPQEIPNAETRASTLYWAPEEDARLLALVKQYGSNWNLVAEVFNTTTQRPSSDLRIGWDMFDRWNKLAGPDSKKVLPDGTEISVPPPEYNPANDKSIKATQFANFDGSKKRLRHLTVFDAMRKVQKKRELTAQKAPPPGLPRRINMNMHDSHNLPPRPQFSPMEWHAVKLEQDAQKMRLRAQQQAEFVAQQQRLQQQQQQAAAMGQQQVGQSNPGSTPGAQVGGARFPQGPIPQGFPAQQSRNMSIAQQQQAAVAAAQAAAVARGSPTGAASLPQGVSAQFAAQVAQAQQGGVNGIQLTPEQIAFVRQQREQQLQAQAQVMAARAAAAAAVQQQQQQAQQVGTPKE
ncbi:RNA polymerase II transcription elongation factor SpEAF [Microbotryomycetes sp. JL201]|nr:RNA polymerase II transcription elongation factor SpEAF [Microbotryomycetes sp. JL201]